MTDFLLELRSEEIPARMQDKARDDLRWAFETAMRGANLHQGTVVTYATPRRLALIARGLADQTELEIEEFKGPKVGAPEQAIEGFLRKIGAPRSDLFSRDDDKGLATYFVQRQKPSRSTAEVLSSIIPTIVRAFPWPKSMRWGAASASPESLRWVRPLHGIVALLGEDVVPVEIAGVQSGAATVGHRFHHPGVITIGSAADYAEKLRACHVIVDQDQRRAIIRDRAGALAAEAGLALIEDEGLVAENAGLTEWPVPLLGRFDPAFLDVPPEVIQLTARVNQKYFVCRDAAGKLANAFVCVANIDAADGGAKIVEGNRKVLAARLSDARFFYDTDLKVPLEEQAKKLEKIVFHEKLGTVADKVDRVARLARWLVEEGIILPFPGEGRGPVSGGSQLDPGLRRGTAEDRAALADQAERAARLAKADLVTGMVGEFPELQGVMGGYYAAAQGEPQAVAAAVRDHYKPVGQGDEVPTAPVTVAVSLADKLDTLVAFFYADLPPTGSKDPFALRRAALGVLELLTRNHLQMSLWHAMTRGLGGLTTQHCSPEMTDLAFEAHQAAVQKAFHALPDFFADRLKVQQREAGVRHDLIDAVFALGGEDDLVRLLARVRALQSFVGTGDGANLLAGYKRAANILKKEGHSPSSLRGEGRGEGQSQADRSDTVPLPPSASPRHPFPGGEREKQLSYTPEPAETALIAALDAAEPAAAAAVQAEDFEAAMAALATLRAPIDAFFDSVTVNDPDADKRASRLSLLARVRDAVHGVADFSKIES